MILKMDLEKVYDRLEWSFVMDSLQCLGIPSGIQSVIYHCISSASVRVNWNGNSTDTFYSSRGLRQEDRSLLIYSCFALRDWVIKSRMWFWVVSGFTLALVEVIVQSFPICALRMI